MAGLLAVVVLSSLTAGVLATGALGQASATAGLAGLRRVAIEVRVAPDHSGLIARRAVNDGVSLRLPAWYRGLAPVHGR